MEQEKIKQDKGLGSALWRWGECAVLNRVVVKVTSLRR